MLIAYGPGESALLAYPALALLAVSSRDRIGFLIRFFAMSLVGTFVAFPWLFSVSTTVAIVGPIGFFLAMLVAYYPLFAFRERPILGAALTTIALVAIGAFLDKARLVSGFVLLSWTVPELADLVAHIGTIASSALLAFASALVVRVRRRRIAIVGLALLVTLVAAGILIPPASKPLASPLTIAVMQTNQNVSWVERQQRSLTRYPDEILNASRRAADAGARLIVWPEYAISRDIALNATLDDRFQAFADSRNVTLVVGTYAVLGPASLRYHPGPRVYRPGVPPVSIPAVRPLHINGWPVGARPSPPIEVPTPSGSIGVSFLDCFEEFTWPHWIDRSGTGLLVIIADHQHLGRGRTLVARMSGIEAARFGTPVLKATNTGVSLVYDSGARPLGSLPPDTVGSLVRTVK